MSPEVFLMKLVQNMKDDLRQRILEDYKDVIREQQQQNIVVQIGTLKFQVSSQDFLTPLKI
jgi:hypothetical protein